MNVVFYLDDLFGGGVQRRTMRLLQGIKDNDTENALNVHLIVNQPGGENKAMVPKQVTYHTLGGVSGKQLKSELGAQLISLNPDIVVCCMGQQFIQALKHRARLPKDCRWYVIQAVPVKLIAYSWLKNKIRTLAIKLFYPQADKVLCVSDDVRITVANLSSALQKKAHTIYNPVVSENLLTLAQEHVEHPFFDSNNIVLVAAGRLNVQKDYGTMLQAFALLTQQHPDKPFKLLILGNGELEEQLKTHIEALGIADKVDLYGFTDNPYKFIRKADLFVMSSLWEGLPNAMVESLAIGKPVVSCDCVAGPREILKDGQLGTLVPMQNPQAFADGIIAELQQNRDTQALQARGWEFSVNNAAKKYIALFKNAEL
ncbi:MULTISPECIES: glycosyltransferase [unclassified Pseudoalteromonas]|uniref:glycosyltransferase n=1 Tax=unclassified Pseudoalteromonas TaxID=194690 RepID=UPI001F2E6573|nr:MULTISPECIES: glycosyltransferase [unclassified Pseudoalteromonas]MCF2828339.1 glycosyltransferase [Pseudoalteromonas sp. OF5H-5]MCF2830554.1 glycosyltransferase [Pseudoalteromonas sp. DL2-H6]MCF2924427.1 glycosyltransferase [Pseudoalteromonas sp. DL2-H1]